MDKDDTGPKKVTDIGEGFGGYEFFLVQKNLEIVILNISIFRNKYLKELNLSIYVFSVCLYKEDKIIIDKVIRSTTRRWHNVHHLIHLMAINNKHNTCMRDLNKPIKNCSSGSNKSHPHLQSFTTTIPNLLSILILNMQRHHWHLICIRHEETCPLYQHNSIVFHISYQSLIYPINQVEIKPTNRLSRIHIDPCSNQ